MKSVVLIATACVASLVSGCIVLQNDTRVRAQNDLVNLSIDVNNVTTDVQGIDLNNVTVGDVLFTAVDAGEITSYAVTDQSGSVEISIEQAVAWLSSTVSMSFTGISPMAGSLDHAKDNTVVFDESTAGVIFTALAKKLPVK